MLCSCVLVRGIDGYQRHLVSLWEKKCPCSRFPIVYLHVWCPVCIKLFPLRIHSIGSVWCSCYVSVKLLLYCAIAYLSIWLFLFSLISSELSFERQQGFPWGLVILRICEGCWYALKFCTTDFCKWLRCVTQLTSLYNGLVDQFGQLLALMPQRTYMEECHNQ